VFYDVSSYGVRAVDAVLRRSASTSSCSARIAQWSRRRISARSGRPRGRRSRRSTRRGCSRRPGCRPDRAPPRRDLERHELEALVGVLAARPELWAAHVCHDRERRVYEQLLRDDHLAVWLICWMDDHDTGFHEHDLSAGAVAMTAGRLREDRLALGGPAITRTYEPGGTFTFSAVDIHRVRHVPGPPAVSLHAYSPPLWRMGAYEIGAGGALRRTRCPTPGS
jgi:hypothetical protein